LGSGGTEHSYSLVDGGEWWAIPFGRFASGKRVMAICLVGPRTGLYMVTKSNKSNRNKHFCKKLSQWLTNKALRREGVWGSGCIDSHFLDLGNSWRWMVSFTPRSLYSREKASGTHCIGGWMDPKAGLDDTEKWKFFTLPGLELRLLGRPARSKSLYRLRYRGSIDYVYKLNICICYLINTYEHDETI
jgi:hypothetical protein